LRFFHFLPAHHTVEGHRDKQKKTLPQKMQRKQQTGESDPATV
jgi:hypothetical protein